MVLMWSCIASEPKNSEADILDCTVADGDLKAAPIITNTDITLMVDRLSSRVMSPVFTLSPGARMEPESGTTLDFSTEQQYLVTSEDGAWRKTYTVRAISDLQMKYDFEQWELVESRGSSYYRMYETVEAGAITEKQQIWASGNPALTIVFGNDSEKYPTKPTSGAKEGSYAAELTTVSTGFGSIVGKPFAAGNLFIGEFNSSIAMARPLEATRFGLPINKIPTGFKGWYKYSSGPVYKDENQKVVEGAIDSCRIYAVFYRSDDGFRLNGENVLTHPDLVSLAFLKKPDHPEEWTEFSLPFVYQNGNTEAGIDLEDLANYRYNFAVVLSSSYEGAYFRGAVGSKLIVDALEVIYDDPNEP